MDTLQTIKREAIKYFVPLLLVAVTPFLLSQFRRIEAFLISKLEESELSRAILLETATILLLLAWVAYLRVRIAGRSNPKDYKPYQPYPGVTVYMEKTPDKNLEYQFWYCPKCLNVDHKIGILQFPPRGGVAVCDRCGKPIELGIKIEH